MSKLPFTPVTVHFDGIGSIKFRRSKLARSLNIRIKPFEGVQVSVPHTMSLKRAEAIVRTKSSWILKNLQKVQEYEKRSVIYDGSKDIRTRAHTLHVKAGTVVSPTVRLQGNRILVTYPAQADLRDSEVQAAVRAGLVAAYRKEAKAYLPGRVNILAVQHGFKYRKIFVKDHKSRWGSCSTVNNINLSLHLMKLPDEIIDYVILHELVHTEIKNHSKVFWQRLAEVCPQYHLLKRRLRALEKSLQR